MFVRLLPSLRLAGNRGVTLTPVAVRAGHLAVGEAGFRANGRRAADGGDGPDGCPHLLPDSYHSALATAEISSAGRPSACGRGGPKGGPDSSPETGPSAPRRGQICEGGLTGRLWPRAAAQRSAAHRPQPSSTPTAHAHESPDGFGPPASSRPGALARNPLRRPPHRPVQTGLRFSLKAASPSRASSVIASSAIWLSV